MNKGSYILHLKNLKPRDEELVGSKSYDKNLLMKEGFSTPEGIVVTSLAFDDFLRSTNLVEPISLLLSEVKPFIKETAISVSEEIRNLIQKAELPKLIEMPLTEAYKGLSPVLEDSFVYVETSHVIDRKFLPENSNFKTENLKGIVQVVESIKDAWCTLFTPEALEYRVNNYYHGPLTIAVIIKKMALGDVSGEFVTTGENLGEIFAVYGVGGSKSFKKEKDIYFVDLETKTIKDKKINTQKFLKVRKGSFKPGSQILMDVEISEDWQNRQKVPDVLISFILESATKLQKILKAPFLFNWSVDAGELIVEDYEKLESNFESSKINEEEIPQNKEERKLPHLPIHPKEMLYVERPKDYPILEVETQSTDIRLLENINSNSNDEFLDEKSNYQIEDIQTVLDISNLSPSKIHNVKFFDKTFFDSSINIKSLIDISNPERSIQLIYSEILTAARSSIPKEFIYSFSNINFGDAKHQFNGDERFIENPEELLVEYIALKRVSQLFKLNQINFVIPAIRSLDNMKNILRVLRSYPDFDGMQNKIYAEVSIPSFLFELTKIDELDNIAGFVLDYSKLLTLLVYREATRVSDHKIMFEVLNEVKKVANHKNFELYIKLDNYKDPIIDQISQMGKSIGIIFSSVPSENIFHKLNRNEDKVKLNLKL